MSETREVPIEPTEAEYEIMAKALRGNTEARRAYTWLWNNADADLVQSGYFRRFVRACHEAVLLTAAPPSEPSAALNNAAGQEDTHKRSDGQVGATIAPSLPPVPAAPDTLPLTCEQIMNIDDHACSIAHYHVLINDWPKVRDQALRAIEFDRQVAAKDVEIARLHCKYDTDGDSEAYKAMIEDRNRQYARAEKAEAELAELRRKS